MEHEKNWDFLKNKFEAGQLAHSYLFSGSQEANLLSFAKEFIKLVNSKTIATSDVAIEKENYPDLLTVKSANSESSIKNEKDMMEIDVGQVRQVNNFLSYKSYYGGYKTVIMENAERMNTQAQNSFLKTLEEPKGNTVIILISSKAETLLPTIFSRCQTIKFYPSQKYAFSKQQQGILQNILPVINQDLAEKFLFAKNVNLENGNAIEILEVLQRHFRNLLLIKIGVVKGEESKYSIEKLKKILRLIETISHQVATTNASSKLALEIILLEL